MHVASIAWVQSHEPDRPDRSRCGAVEQDGRRLRGRELQIDGDRVALICPHALGAGVEGEALLVAGGNEFEDHLAGQRDALRGSLLDQLADVRPALAVERQPYLLRLM